MTMQKEIRSTAALLLERVILSWCWVVFFIIFCFMFFEQGQYRRDLTFKELDSHLKELTLAKAQALALQNNLLLQINSQSDPKWIELVLRKGLGVIPEGQMKVYFKPPPR